jgi:hypothetical protein
MINKLKLFAVGMLGAAAVVSANAKPVPAASTALLSTVNVALTVYTQGPTTTARNGVVRDTIAPSALTTKALITALTGSFQAGDLLVHVTPLTNYTSITGYTTNSFTNEVVVTNGSTITTNPVVTNSITTNTALITTNLAGYFEVLHGASANVLSNGVLSGYTTLIDGLTNMARVHGEIIRANGTIVSGSSISIGELFITISNSWNLSLQGVVRSTAVPVVVYTGSGSTQFNTSDTTWTLNGSGFDGVVTNNTPAVVVGTVTEHYFKRE